MPELIWGGVVSTGDGAVLPVDGALNSEAQKLKGYILLVHLAPSRFNNGPICPFADSIPRRHPRQWVAEWV
jgi:hypothetical protein